MHGKLAKRSRLKGVLLLFPAIIFCGCFSLFDQGPATVIKVSYNPSKSKQAILFINDGNATISESFQVSVKDSDDSLVDAEVGNTFTVDDDHGKTTLDSTSIRFEWLDDAKLIISYDKKLRTFIKAASVNGVKIQYKSR